MKATNPIVRLLNVSLQHKSLLLLLTAIICGGVFLYSHAIVKLSISTDTHGHFKIYFPGDQGKYSEENAARVTIRPGRTEYFFKAQRIKGNGPIRIRIDPINQVAKLKIYHVSFYQFPFGKIDIVSDRRFDRDLADRLVPNNQISTLQIKPKYIAVKAGGGDGQLNVWVNPSQETEPTFAFLYLFVFLFLFVVFFHKIAVYNLDSYGIIPLLMGMVLGLVLVMATISKPYNHPDEIVHIRSASYYSENWLPPEILCHPDMKWSYSPYGVSRLNSLESFYFFAGKYIALAKFIPGQTIFQFRSFNVFLFAILTLMAVLRPAFRLYCVPLLLSPQIWYVFSYFNSDAFALFICYLLLYQLFMPDSLLRRFIDTKNRHQLVTIGAIIVGGLLFGLIPFIKKNYYAFGAYLICFGIITLFNYRAKVSKAVLMRWGAVFCMAILIIAGRYGLDGYINGTDRSSKETQCQETFARYKFKRSTPAADKWFGLRMREKGITLEEVFNRFGWGRISFQSTFGVYGPMSIYPSSWIISTFKAILLCFLGGILYCGVKGGLYSWSHIVNFGIWGAFLVFASLWNSWNADLQNQGRYLFPIVAMGAMLLNVLKPSIPKQKINMLTMIAFCVGVISFVSIGLARIPKA